MKNFLNKYKTVFTYLLSSGLSFIVDIISFSIILYFIKDRFVDAILLSSYVARAISSVVNYIVNKKYVFKIIDAAIYEACSSALLSILLLTINKDKIIDKKRFNKTLIHFN